MDLLSESFGLDSTVDLTESEYFELSDNGGTAHAVTQTDVFNASITTTTTIDQLTGGINTFVVKEKLPTHMQQVTTEQLTKQIVDLLREDIKQHNLPVSSPVYDIGLIARAFNADQATQLYQRALLIQLKDDALFYKIQTQQALAFRQDYQIRLDKQEITSVANTTEYIEKYVKKTCYDAYYSSIILNQRIKVQHNITQLGSSTVLDERDFLSFENTLKALIEPKNPYYLHKRSPMTNQPIRVNLQSTYITVKQLEAELELAEDWVIHYVCQSKTAESMLDFIKKRQPMYYDLDSILA